MQNTKAWWEVPEVDLNLRHYSGGPSDTIKQIKYDIEKFLVNPDVDDKTRQIYSAIYISVTSSLVSKPFTISNWFCTAGITSYLYSFGKNGKVFKFQNFNFSSYFSG